jgi:small-conductance mechanosensitive channel
MTPEDAPAAAPPPLLPGQEMFETWLPQLLWVGGVVVFGVALGWLLGFVFRRWSERWAKPLGPGRATLIGRIVGVTVFVLASVLTLHLSGLPLSGLMTWVAGAAGIAGVAIGFASQTSASNIISGMFLLAERPFEEGDFVRIDQVSGQVLAVDLLSVKLRTFDNLFVRVPNETAMRSVITNISRFEIRRIDLLLRFAADAPLERVKATLEACAAEHSYILAHPAPQVLFNGIVDGAVELQLNAWTRGDGFVDARAKWAVALIAALREAGLPLVGASRSIRVLGDGDALKP